MDTGTTTTVDQSITSAGPAVSPPHRSKWLKVTAVAAVSALTGGMAAAWYYRKTLSQLQKEHSNHNNPNFGSIESKDADGD